VIRGGEKTYRREIEAFLDRHPAVQSTSRWHGQLRAI
jgi:hypothetical protein